MSYATIQRATLQAHLRTVDQHNEGPTAGATMTLRRQISIKLSDVHCPIAETRDRNWSFILYPTATFVRLAGIVNADGTDGTAVPAINDPGAPIAGNHAQTEIWKYNKTVFNDYQTVLAVTKETMAWAFPNEDVFLNLRDPIGHLFHTPIELFDYTWEVFATAD